MANRYSLEAAFNLIDNITKPLEKITGSTNVVGNAIKKNYTEAQKRVDNFGKTVEKATGLLKKAAIAAQGAAVAAAGAFVAKGFKDALEYDTALRKVSTVADTTAVSMNTLSKGIMKVSNETGTAVAELTELQYNAIVSGIKTADSVGFVEAAVKAADASFSDTAVVIDSLTAVLNAYGLEASEASKIAGQMLITNNLGKTSFNELNSSLGEILPTASSLSVGTDELFASLTALTANTIETPKAVKGLEKVLETIQNPTDSVSKAARRLGVDFSAAALRSKGLAGFLDELKRKTGGNEDAIRSLFNSQEAFNSIMVLTGKGAGQFTDALNAMTGATDALNTAFETVDASPAEQWGDILNKIRNTGIKLGTALLPVFQKIIDKFSLFVDKFSEMDFGSFVTQIEATLDRIFNSIDFDKIVSGITNFFNVLPKGLNLLTGIVGLFLKFKDAIAVIGIGGFAAKRVFDGIAIAGKIAPVIGDLKTAGSLVKGLANGSYAAQTAFDFVSDRVKNMTKIMQGAQKVGSTIFDIGKMVAGKAAALAMAAAQGVATAATTAWAAATSALNAAWLANPIGLVIAGIVLLIGFLVLLYNKCEPFRNFVNSLLDKLKEFGAFIVEGLGKALKSLAGFIQQNSEKVLAFITIFTGPFGFIISIVKELKDNWGAVVEAFKTDGIIAGLKKLGGVILSGILAPIQGFLEMLSKIPIIGEKIAPAADKIKEFRDQLKGVETENTVVQNIVPGSITNPVPETLTQTVNTTARIVPPLNNGINNRTITAAATAPGGASFPGETAPVPPQLNRVTPPAITRTGMAPIPAPQVDPVTIRVGKVEGLNEQLRGLTADVTLVENVVPGKINSVTPPIVDQPRRVTASPAMPSFSGVNLNNRTITAAATAPTPPMTTAEQYYYTEKTSREQVDIGIRTEPGTTATIARQPRSPNVRVLNAGGNNVR
jgi:TP901 family phage tail tape measure protein